MLEDVLTASSSPSKSRLSTTGKVRQDVERKARKDSRDLFKSRQVSTHDKEVRKKSDTWLDFIHVVELAETTPQYPESSEEALEHAPNRRM
jgi:hypothetical protein